MIARTIRIVYVSPTDMYADEGWTAPDGWRIVNSEKKTSAYTVTLVKS